MVEVSSSSSFDTASTAAVRISSQNSSATVRQTLTGADVAFLAENKEYYVRGNASNAVCLHVFENPDANFSLRNASHACVPTRLIPHSACAERIQVACSAYSSVVTTGQIVSRFACSANYFLWGPTRGAEKCHPCLVCTILRWFLLL